MYIPETLDMSSLTHPDQIACLTDAIYTMPVYRRDCDEGCLVPLNKTRLRQQFGQMGLDVRLRRPRTEGLFTVTRRTRRGIGRRVTASGQRTAMMISGNMN